MFNLFRICAPSRLTIQKLPNFIKNSALAIEPVNNAILLNKYRIPKTFIIRNYTKSTKYSTDSNSSVKIYAGSLSTRLRILRVYSVTTSLTGVTYHERIYTFLSSLGGTFTTASLCGLAGIIVFLMPVGIHLVTRRYVVEMTHNLVTDEYTAMRISFWFLKQFVIITSF